jgi:type II secretory pathway pseudopilin PulG
MKLRAAPIRKSTGTAGFTLAEVLMAFFIFALVSSGVVFGYVQSNRMAQWSALSLAAQAYASEGAEQARAADWRPRDFPPTNGPGTMDELPIGTNVIAGTNLMLDLPSSGAPGAGAPFYVTNIIAITTASVNPPLRQIRSDAIWVFALTGKVYTNTTILQRAPDQ